MKGDYYRYIAEMYDDDDDESKANKEGKMMHMLASFIYYTIPSMRVH
jgi:hypothetical protein